MPDSGLGAQGGFVGEMMPELAWKDGWGVAGGRGLPSPGRACFPSSIIPGMSKKDSVLEVGMEGMLKVKAGAEGRNLFRGRHSSLRKECLNRQYRDLCGRP